MEGVFGCLRDDTDAQSATEMREAIGAALRAGQPELLQLNTNVADIEVDLLSGDVSLYSVVDDDAQVKTDVVQFVSALSYITIVERAFADSFGDRLFESMQVWGASEVKPVLWGGSAPAVAYAFPSFDLLFVLEEMRKIEVYCGRVSAGGVPQWRVRLSLSDLCGDAGAPEWIVRLHAEQEGAACCSAERTVAYIALMEAFYSRLFRERGQHILNTLAQNFARHEQ